MADRKCTDCENLSPRDVFKGYCVKKAAPAVIDIDAVDCAAFSASAKCQFCNQYKGGLGPDYSRDALGDCKSQATMVYAELKACKSFMPN